MKKMILILIIFLLLLTTTGCGVWKGTKIAEKTIATNTKQMETIQRNLKQEHVNKKFFFVKKRQYVGADRVLLSWEDSLPASFDQSMIFYSGCKNLGDAVEKIAKTTGVTIKVPFVTSIMKENGQEAISPVDLEKAINLSYEGTLKGVLDYVASYYGISWEYEAGKVSFYVFKTKTYSISTGLGEIEIETDITNKSESGASEETGDSKAEGSQKASFSNKSNLFLDLKADLDTLVQMGATFVNSSAGTVTVISTPTEIKLVDSYIQQLNEKMTRQVIVSVKVYALDLDSENAMNFSLDAAFKTLRDDFQVVSNAANPFALPGGVGNLSAIVLESANPTNTTVRQFANSEAVIKALSSHGDVSLVTSGSGITLNNQPLPIQIIQRTGYLASVGLSEIDDDSSMTELQPGQVSTGFSMLAVPHILDSGQIVLRYSLNLSSLNDLKTISSGGQSIQTPEISTRSFMQTVKMKMGSTLFMAGFEEVRDETKNGSGFLQYSKTGIQRKSIFIISITLSKG